MVRNNFWSKENFVPKMLCQKDIDLKKWGGGGQILRNGKSSMYSHYLRKTLNTHKMQWGKLFFETWEIQKLL